MKYSTLWASVMLTVLVTTAAVGEPITIGQTESLRSELLDEERTYRIALPSDYANKKTRYPVIYLLGGNETFHYTTGIVKILAQEGLVPPMITVGVQNMARTRDLTTPWTSPNPPVHLKRFIGSAGGADRFVKFLTTELAPYIEEHYRTAPFRILIGRSLGGLFALHTLFTSPDAFDGYISISPSTHWDEGVILREMEAFIGREPEESQKFLFLSIADEGGEVLENYRRLVERLEYDAPTNLHWAQREFIEDDHGTAILPGIHRGMETIFHGWRPPANQRERGLDGFDQHFARLSRRYGFDIPVPESTINVLGLRALAMGNTAEGIRILTQNAERYPESAYARDCLGRALEEDGQLESAVVQYERAVALGTAAGDPDLPVYQEHLDALRRALQAGVREPPKE